MSDVLIRKEVSSLVADLEYAQSRGMLREILLQVFYYEDLEKLKEFRNKITQALRDKDL